MIGLHFVGFGIVGVVKSEFVVASERKVEFEDIQLFDFAEVGEVVTVVAVAVVEEDVVIVIGVVVGFVVVTVVVVFVAVVTAVVVTDCVGSVNLAESVDFGYFVDFVGFVVVGLVVVVVDLSCEHLLYDVLLELDCILPKKIRCIYLLEVCSQLLR